MQSFAYHAVPPTNLKNLTLQQGKCVLQGARGPFDAACGVDRAVGRSIATDSETIWECFQETQINNHCNIADLGGSERKLN
jgi:hypothetical protein